MADELMNLPPADAAPVLTLDPMTTQAPVMAELAPKPEEIPEDLSENNLTPEEKKMVEDFAKTIDVTNSNVILTYGAAAQQKIAGFSESALKSVRTKDMGEIGEMVSNLVTELRAFSPEEESKGGFFSLFKKPANKIAAMKSKYDKAETSVDKICAQLEADIADMEGEEKTLFLSELGLEHSGLDRLIQKSYHLLGLISYLTAGPQEVRAWTITRGTKAPKAAGKIHTDFERGFIRAEVVSFADLEACGGSMTAAKEKGLVRSEGKEYVMQDGDVVLFRFNV